MLIVALVLAVIGLAALVTAVVTSNELVAWVCIAASVIGVILLIIDAIRERQHVDKGDEVAEADPPTEVIGSGETIDQTYQNFDAEYPDEDDAPTSAARAAEAPETENLEAVSVDQANSEEKPSETRPETPS